MRLVQSIIYNLHKGTMGFLVTWQGLWMLVGSGFGMVSFGLGIGLGEGGSSDSQAVSVSIDTYTLVDQHIISIVTRHTK